MFVQYYNNNNNNNNRKIIVITCTNCNVRNDRKDSEHSLCCSRTWFATKAPGPICFRPTPAAKSPRRKSFSFSCPRTNPVAIARAPVPRQVPDERPPTVTHDGRRNINGRHPSIRNHASQPASQPDPTSTRTDAYAHVHARDTLIKTQKSKIIHACGDGGRAKTKRKATSVCLSLTHTHTKTHTHTTTHTHTHSFNLPFPVDDGR
jgi:hypothetical protein